MRQRALVATAVLWSVLALVPALEAQGTGDRFGMWDVHVNEDPVTGEDLRIAAGFRMDTDLFFSFVCRDGEPMALLRPFDHDTELPVVGTEVTVYWATNDPALDTVREQWVVTEQGVTAVSPQVRNLVSHIRPSTYFIIGMEYADGKALTTSYDMSAADTRKMIDMMECLT